MHTASRLTLSLSAALALQACLDPNANTESASTTTGPGTPGTDTTSGVPSDPTTGDPTGDPPVTTGADPVCGDGFVDADEECDLGPANADDGDCTTACRNAVCGDGLVNLAAEQCDEGPDNADDGACTTACLPGVCGDGLVKSDEACDDGVNDGSYGGCAADCSALAPACGDGQLDGEFEDCDDGPDCLPTCKFARSCLDWQAADPAAVSGVFTIRREGIMEPLDVWCALEADVDGGGYTFLKVDASGMNPNAPSASSAETTCADFGMRLFVPRSAAHLVAAHQFAVADNLPPVGGGMTGSGADYLQILGIYPVTPGESCVDQPLNAEACPEWRAGDEQTWWVSDAAVGSGEPDTIGACSGCSMLYQWNQDGSVKSYKALPQPGGFSFRFLCDVGDKLP
ncbi:hypothetical protein [Nannocystis pusilla]|uniref:Myxococcus cysteine-rich repeat-containing protein n=1 Tax=Nannocystis pusilla TaxID=889268 RepID=A0ABS7TQK3_9BACT|nr:hypothetical protein [Nannocystis pusilla]MBZ5710456.1 hypothetical protein [Nannocystis pusilla]